MKELLLIRGLPGSGKSRFAQIFLNFNAYFEADQFRINADGVYQWTPQNNRSAHIDCQDAVAEAMQTGIPRIAVGNTFTRNWEMQAYRELAQLHGYKVTVITVESGLDSEELCKRNVHDVPLQTIQMMERRWEKYGNPE